MSEPKIKLIPNTFQCFNDHVDMAMELLSGDEYKVLNFATRHILGWKDTILEEKRRISLTMFEQGFITKDGRHFGGTGLGRKTLVRILDFLTDCGLLIAAGKANEDGTLWELGDAPDWSKLTTRARGKEIINQRRTAKAREKSLTTRKNGVSDTPAGGLSDTPPSSSVGHTSTGDVGHTSGGAVGHTQLNPMQNPSQNPLNAAAKSAAAGDAPSDVSVVTEGTAIEPVKETMQTPVAAKSPSPNSAPPPPHISDPRAEVFTLYHKCFDREVDGQLLKEELLDMVDTYTLEWCRDAFKETARKPATSLNYTLQILRRWQREGKPELTVLPKPTGAQHDAPLIPSVKLPKPIIPASAGTFPAPKPVLPVLPKASGGNDGNS